MIASPEIRVLRIIARLNIGGPAIQAVKLSAGLSNPPYRTLLVCGNVGAAEGDMSYLAASEGIKPTLLPSLSREISILDDCRSFRFLRKVIGDFRPHIIHTHTAKAGTLGRLAGISTNLLPGCPNRIRLIHTFHGHVFEGYFGPRKTALFIRIERFLAGFTDRIVVISPLQFADICEKYRVAAPEKVRIVPLGFDLAPFREARLHRKQAREELVQGTPEDVLVVGIVGRLTSIKNHRMLLDAAAILKERGHGSSFRFLVIGDGEMRTELEEYSRKSGVADLITFAGWRKDMPRIYGAMDAMALTSINEGTPVTLIEAMASGVPVVATAVGGVADLLGRPIDERGGYRIAERGILVRSGDPLKLAEALFFLLKNKDTSERITERAIRYIFKKYALERLFKDVENLYSEVLAG